MRQPTRRKQSEKAQIPFIAWPQIVTSRYSEVEGKLPDLKQQQLSTRTGGVGGESARAVRLKTIKSSLFFPSLSLLLSLTLSLSHTHIWKIFSAHMDDLWSKLVWSPLSYCEEPGFSEVHRSVSRQ